MTKVRELGIDASGVVSADVDPLGRGDDLIVTVGQSWRRAAKSDRERDAQVLWQMWVAVTQNPDADSVHIKFVDVGGNVVAGSGVMGSSIDVND